MRGSSLEPLDFVALMVVAEGGEWNTGTARIGQKVATIQHMVRGFLNLLMYERLWIQFLEELKYLAFHVTKKIYLTLISC